jgi:hypothetical protein
MTYVPSPPGGHVERRRGARSDTWYARYRLPDGRHVKRKIGPAWTERGKPPVGFHTRRTHLEERSAKQT